MRLIFLQLVKDLRDMLSTHTAVLILFTPVLLSAVIHRTARNSDVRKVVLAVTAPASSGFLRALEMGSSLDIVEVKNEAEGREKITHRDALGYVFIPEGFDDAISRKDFPELTLLVDEAFPTQVLLLRASVRAALAEQAGQNVPADVTVKGLGSKPAETKTNLLSLWVLFAVISSLAVSASSMVEEKEAGTLQQILMTPATLPQVILGKVAAGSVLAGISALLVLAWSAPKGASWSSLLLLLIVGVVAFSSTGTLVGLLAEGATAANAWTGLLFLALFVPVSLAETSRLMSEIAVLTPAYYLYDGLQRSLVSGAPPAGVALHLGVLCLFTVVIVGASSRRLRKMAL